MTKLVMDWSVTQAWLCTVEGTFAKTRDNAHTLLEYWWPTLSHLSYRKFSNSELVSLSGLSKGQVATAVDLLVISGILLRKKTGDRTPLKFKLSKSFARELKEDTTVSDKVAKVVTPDTTKKVKVPKQTAAPTPELTTAADLLLEPPYTQEKTVARLRRLQEKTDDRVDRAVCAIKDILGGSSGTGIDERALCAIGELRTVQGYACSMQRLLLLLNDSNTNKE